MLQGTLIVRLTSRYRTIEPITTSACPAARRHARAAVGARRGCWLIYQDKWPRQDREPAARSARPTARSPPPRPPRPAPSRSSCDICSPTPARKDCANLAQALTCLYSVKTIYVNFASGESMGRTVWA